MLTTNDDNIPEALCLIDGQWIAGEGPCKETISPSTGKPVSKVHYASAAQVDAAVKAAERAQLEWAKRPMAERADILIRAVDAIVPHVEELSVWVSREMGKTINESRYEMGPLTVDVSKAAVEDARRFGGSAPPPYDAAHTTRRVMTVYEPIGVAGLISPWNFPVDMLVGCVAALVVGNAVVWKPSEWAPLSPQLAARIFAEAGLPAGIFNLVYGGPEIGEALVTHPGVGVIGFIGSTAVGEQITRAAGVKRLLLELGGNGPMVVLDDADIDAAVQSAVESCFYMAGQVCTAAERLIVHEAIHDEFVSKLVERTKALRMGDPMDDLTEMGPISEERIMAKIERHVEDARAQGATIEVGGRRDGMYYEATVLTGVRPGMQIADEETFGPVAPIIKVASAAEALAIANDSPYGLSMAVWTSSLKTAFEMAEGLQAGAVAVNGGTNDWEINGPFGGYKKSGIGRELGEDSLRAFTNAKTISFNTL
jgi:acyl-CoA reductase-like NAD-dependent aldehyde dehydrogenase